ncbi:helix-turn-helix transcriptional regulator [Roseobacteraceae bacterium S113]
MRKLLDITERMRSAASLDDLWTTANRELENYGVSGIFYGQLASKSELIPTTGGHDRQTSLTLLSKTSYSEEFLAAFDTVELVDNDPTVTHCLQNDDVLVWSYDEIWAEQNPWYLQRYAIERDLGFHKGCSIPSRHFSDHWIGGIGVAMTEVPDDEFEAHWKNSQNRVIEICGLLELGMREVHEQEFIGLTPREAECLTWLAAGFAPQEIALKMNVQENRVARLVAQCKAKLKARTRDHAVARALLLGVINP